MKINKFNEKYEIDLDNDISNEYVKAIISDYIDNIEDGGTIQDSFDKYCEKDLEEELREIVYHQLLHFSNLLESQSNELIFTDKDYSKRDLERDTKKYNL